MRRRPCTMRLLGVVLLLVSIAPPVLAEQGSLAPPDARISDRVVQADHDVYASVQARIKAQNDGGRPVSDYFLAKAQCWLDASFHEYTRNDRSPFPQEALNESDRLVAAMEAKQVVISRETPLVNAAARLRPDLWSRAAVIEGSAGLACAAQKVACAEVELVHAGNEHNQQGWRHAKPYVEIAEGLIAEADVLARHCTTPVAATAVTPAVRVTETFLVAHVEFRFDGSAKRDIVPASLEQLDALIRRAREGTIRSVRLVGYADRLNGTGNAAYNQTLSEKRGATVHELLIAAGIQASAIETSARGDGQALETCSGRFPSKTALEQCLAPNRRVEVQVLTSR